MVKTRRNFLLATLAGTTIFLTLKLTKFEEVKNIDTLSQLQDDLFPEQKYIPKKKQINAKAYLILILNHPRVLQSDKDFLINSAKLLNEKSEKLYAKSYNNLHYNQRQKLLKEIATTSWGESFIADNLKFIFEAMLGDPIYGSNKDESGWIWLEHKAGLPRPKVAYL
jgi:hypothetical protein